MGLVTLPKTDMIFPMKVLVVEDDAAIRKFLVRGLTEEGLTVDEASDGIEGLAKASKPEYDVMLLDLMLPNQDGLTVLRKLRATGSTIPVLVLTARDAVADRIAGLDCGADDYLIKPFAFGELLARIRSLLRRARKAPAAVLQAGSLTLDRIARTVLWKDVPVELSGREFSILEHLMQHPGDAINRMRIYQAVWNEPMLGFSNTVDVHIKEIRRKLADAGAGRDIIVTVRGVGFRLEDSAK